MKRTIHNNSLALTTVIELDGFKVLGKGHSKAVVPGQSARSAKSNKIQRCAAIKERIEDELLRIAFKANRADRQREERRAKR